MVVVVYRKSIKSKKYFMHIFPNEKTADRINNDRASKPLIPNNYIIEEIGLGESFVGSYKNRYNIKTYKTVG